MLIRWSATYKSSFLYNTNYSAHELNMIYFYCSVLAAKNLGEAIYNNFIDHTFLGDRKTTIREYLATTGSGIMEEEPPELLKNRYGGWHWSMWNFLFCDIIFNEAMVYDLKKVEVETVRLEHFFCWTGQAPTGLWIFRETSAELV